MQVCVGGSLQYIKATNIHVMIFVISEKIALGQAQSLLFKVMIYKFNMLLSFYYSRDL